MWDSLSITKVFSFECYQKHTESSLSLHQINTHADYENISASQGVTADDTEEQEELLWSPVVLELLHGRNRLKLMLIRSCLIRR